jgi:hypothetical protein
MLSMSNAEAPECCDFFADNAKPKTPPKQLGQPFRELQVCTCGKRISILFEPMSTLGSDTIEYQGVRWDPAAAPNSIPQIRRR